jgi:uncharacterized protein (UPF0147 family)
MRTSVLQQLMQLIRDREITRHVRAATTVAESNLAEGHVADSRIAAQPQVPAHPYRGWSFPP